MQSVARSGPTETERRVQRSALKVSQRVFLQNPGKASPDRKQVDGGRVKYTDIVQHTEYKEFQNLTCMPLVSVVFVGILRGTNINPYDVSYIHIYSNRHMKRLIKDQIYHVRRGSMWILHV